MSKLSYYDPNFYICSEKVPYTIRGDVELFDDVDADCLTGAVLRAVKRFPYFRVQVIIENEEYIVVPNERPFPVFESDRQVILGSPDVNYHLAAVTYSGKHIYFNFSHNITDGCGRAPFTMAVLYYYVTQKYNVDIDPKGFYLEDTPFFDDELGCPVADEEKMMAADGRYFRHSGSGYKLSESGRIKDPTRCEYRFKCPENEYIYIDKYDLENYYMAEGKIICFPSFTSTSFIKGFTPTNNALIVNNYNNEKILLKMELAYSPQYDNIPQGMILGNFSENPEEEEILLFPFTFIKVKSIKKKKYNLYKLKGRIIDKDSILEFGLRKGKKVVLKNENEILTIE